MIFLYIPHTNNEDVEIQLIQRYSLSTEKLKVKSKNIARQILLGCRQEELMISFVKISIQQKMLWKDTKKLTEQSTVFFFFLKITHILN